MCSFLKLFILMSVFVCIIINVFKFCSFAGFYLFSDNEKDEVLDNTCLCIIV